MTFKGLAALTLATLLGLTATRAAAADPKLPDTKAFDKLVIDSLREAHNQGAELYNTSKDFAGAYRLYQGALVTIRPLLGHRPETQKLIDNGFVAVTKETDVARKAFVLHETIESVRKNLKITNGFLKPEDKKQPEDKKTEPPPKPKVNNPAGATVSGTVTFKGKPVAAADLTLVSLNLPAPRVFTASIKDGRYQFAEMLPAGQYAAIVTGEGIPEKYQLVPTAALRIELAAGENQSNIVLK